MVMRSFIVFRIGGKEYSKLSHFSLILELDGVNISCLVRDVSTELIILLDAGVVNINFDKRGVSATNIMTILTAIRGF